MLLRGCPPFALLFRGSPPIPLMYTVHKERTLLFGGVPPFFFTLALHWGSALPIWGVPLSPLPSRRLCTLLGGGSPLLLRPLAAR